MTTRGANWPREAAAGGRGRDWKPIEGRRRQTRGGACGWMKFAIITKMPLEKNFQITLNFSIEVENL
jgi:hypothetical protein